MQHRPSRPKFALCVETFIAKFAFVFLQFLEKRSELVLSAKGQSDFISSLVAAINLITSLPCVQPLPSRPQFAFVFAFLFVCAILGKRFVTLETLERLISGNADAWHGRIMVGYQPISSFHFFGMYPIF